MEITFRLSDFLFQDSTLILLMKICLGCIIGISILLIVALIVFTIQAYRDIPEND